MLLFARQDMPVSFTMASFLVDLLFSMSLRCGFVPLHTQVCWGVYSFQLPFVHHQPDSLWQRWLREDWGNCLSGVRFYTQVRRQSSDMVKCFLHCIACISHMICSRQRSRQHGGHCRHAWLASRRCHQWIALATRLFLTRMAEEWNGGWSSRLVLP